MNIQVEAVYHDGALWPKQLVALPDGTEVRFAIETREQAADPLAGVIGIGEGPPSGDVAERHDDYLYGKS